MQLTIVAVGHRMPDWVRLACEDYLKRMPRDLPLQLIEVKPAARGAGRPVDRLLEEERGRLRERIAPTSRLVTLDERGAVWTTRELAARIETARQDSADLTFLIGGADGLHEEFKATALPQFALSRLTLPHALARVVLVEQLYRAVSVLNNHPYHRD